MDPKGELELKSALNDIDLDDDICPWSGFWWSCTLMLVSVLDLIAFLLQWLFLLILSTGSGGGCHDIRKQDEATDSTAAIRGACFHDSVGGPSLQTGQKVRSHCFDCHLGCKDCSRLWHRFGETAIGKPDDKTEEHLDLLEGGHYHPKNSLECDVSSLQPCWRITIRIMNINLMSIMTTMKTMTRAGCCLLRSPTPSSLPTRRLGSPGACL